MALSESMTSPSRPDTGAVHIMTASTCGQDRAPEPPMIPKRSESPDVDMQSVAQATSGGREPTLSGHGVKVKKEPFDDYQGGIATRRNLSSGLATLREQHAVYDAQNVTGNSQLNHEGQGPNRQMLNPSGLPDIANDHDTAMSGTDQLALFETYRHLHSSAPMNSTSSELPDLPGIQQDIEDNLDLMDEPNHVLQTNTPLDADDAGEYQRFCEMRDAYWQAIDDGKLTPAQSLEFLHASRAELERQRLRNVQVEEANALFIPEQADHHNVDTVDNDSFDSPVSEPDAGHDQPTTKSDKRKRKSPKEATSRPNKRKAGARTVDMENQPLFNIGSLVTHDLIGQAQSNQGQAAQPTTKETVKSKALAEMLSSLSKEERKEHRDDRALLEDATKRFHKRGALKSHGDGTWLLAGMKSSLRNHQVIGTAKMRLCESSTVKPYGGILADEMGFGKTIMTIANIIDGQVKEAQSRSCTTLIVVPANLKSQWFSEIMKHADTSKCLKRVKIYKATDYQFDSDSVRALQDYEIVIASYNEVSRSMPKKLFPAHLLTSEDRDAWWARHFEEHRGLLHRVNFHRIILDEAHYIKNHASKTSEAVWRLEGKYRWAISGTPVQNRLEEFFPFFRFLRIVNTGDYSDWVKNHCKHGSAKAVQRLNVQLQKFMIRRTHEDKLFGRPLVTLPEIKAVETIHLKFNVVERAIYNIVEARFRARINEAILRHGMKVAFALALVLLLRLRQITDHPFLIQRTLIEFLEKEDLDKLEQLVLEHRTDMDQDCFTGFSQALGRAKSEQGTLSLSAESPVDKFAAKTFRKYMQGFNQVDPLDDSGKDILCAICTNIANSPVLTSCKHLFCSDCLREWEFSEAAQDGDHVRCFTCGKRCTREREISTSSNSNPDADDGVPRRLVRNKKSPKNYDDDDEELGWYAVDGEIWRSAKIQAAVDKLEQWWRADFSSKIIIFTQFRGVIRVLARICNEKGWGFVEFHGGLSMKHRDQAIKKFTHDPDVKVFLAGLKAGGVGLNLTAANRVLIIDLWWNVSVEEQAYCRAFRIGQLRPMEVARLVVDESVDMRLLAMQQRKTKQISQVMSKKKAKDKWTPEELLDLFGALKRNAAGEVIDGGEDAPYIVSKPADGQSDQEVEEQQEIDQQLEQIMQRPIELEDE